MKTVLLVVCLVVLAAVPQAHAGFMMGYAMGQMNCDSQSQAVAKALADAQKSCAAAKDQTACVIQALQKVAAGR